MSVQPRRTELPAHMCMHFVCWWCRGNEGLPPVSWPLCAREKATAGRESWSSMGTTGSGVNALWGRMGGIGWVCWTVERWSVTYRTSQSQWASQPMLHWVLRGGCVYGICCLVWTG